MQRYLIINFIHLCILYTFKIYSQNVIVFLPLINKLFNTLEKIISKLTEFVENHKSLVKVIGLVITGIGGLKIISLVLPLFKAFASCVILPIKMLGTFRNQAELARIGSLA
ncbi:hypothetical protein, partial [Helicobacter anatolicus]|uniref:hypothetical protein n=1 Tax=Helicobacter anatolicus TaxID=2905874 RepID=UPI001E2BE580